MKIDFIIVLNLNLCKAIFYRVFYSKLKIYIDNAIFYKCITLVI